MNLNLSENIRRLRKEQDITQERLAEYLGVSHQAISKWESGDVYPDVTLLPILANIFGVTLDLLFGIDHYSSAEVTKEITQKVTYFYVSNRLLEAEKLLRDSLEQYPRSYELMLQLATVLRNRYKENTEKDQSLLKESISKCNMVLSECIDDEIRYKAKRGLAIAYCMCGDQTKAIEIAKSIPITEDIMEYILSGDERVTRCQQNILSGIDKITSRIIHLSDLSMAKSHYDDALYYLKLAENILGIIFENGDYNDLADTQNQINYSYAKVYIAMKQYDKCLDYLSRYLSQIKLITTLYQIPRYTSRVFNMLDCDIPLEKYKEALKSQVKANLNDTVFDSIRQSPEFLELCRGTSTD